MKSAVRTIAFDDRTDDCASGADDVALRGLKFKKLRFLMIADIHPNRGARLNLEITKNDKNKTKSAAVAICLLKEIYVRSGPKGSD